MVPTTVLAFGLTPAKETSRNPHGQLNISCENCHTLDSWKPIRRIPEFDHNKTGLPLRGLHAGVACRLCHLDLVFKNVGTTCADCHADIHRRQFGAKCEECHTVKGWDVARQSVREHQNRFPLIGAHAAVDCHTCHKGAAVGQFTGLNVECVSCHLTDYQQTKVIDHPSAGFPTTCEICHAMDSWSGARFDHARYTGFALTGAHVTLACTACHVGGRYAGTPIDCYSCHQQDYAGTTNPNHVAAGFPTTCSTCHNTSSWSGASFDHTRFTGFALTGAHATLACTACHVGGRYAGTPTDCYSCHQQAYANTTNPNHTAAGFPTTCATCHTTSTWTGASFNHTWFPRNHHGADTCGDCHTNPSNYAAFTCFNCHPHDDKTSTDSKHQGVAGYVYNSINCYSCHPTGRAG